MAISIELIKKLREETGAGVVEAKKILEENNGDFEKAKSEMQKRGLAKIEKRKDRVATEGVIETYIHTDKKTGVMVELLCETDFVGRTEDFQSLAHELAMQAAAMEPATVDELLAQPWIKDEKKKIAELVNETAAKTGENVIVRRFVRFKLGEQ